MVGEKAERAKLERVKSRFDPLYASSSSASSHQHAHSTETYQLHANEKVVLMLDEEFQHLL